YERIQGRAVGLHRPQGALQPGSVHVEKLAALAHHWVEEDERCRHGSRQVQAPRQLTPEGGQTDGGQHHEENLYAAENAVEGEVAGDTGEPQRGTPERPAEVQQDEESGAEEGELAGESHAA